MIIFYLQVYVMVVNQGILSILVVRFRYGSEAHIGSASRQDDRAEFARGHGRGGARRFEETTTRVRRVEKRREGRTAEIRGTRATIERGEGKEKN